MTEWTLRHREPAPDNNVPQGYRSTVAITRPGDQVTSDDADEVAQLLRAPRAVFEPVDFDADEFLEDYESDGDEDAALGTDMSPGREDSTERADVSMIDPAAVELEVMSYRRLQQLAQEYDIPANQSEDDLVEALEDVGDDAEAAADGIEDASEDAEAAVDELEDEDEDEDDTEPTEA